MSRNGECAAASDSSLIDSLRSQFLVSLILRLSLRTRTRWPTFGHGPDNSSFFTCPSRTGRPLTGSSTMTHGPSGLTRLTTPSSHLPFSTLSSAVMPSSVLWYRNASLPSAMQTPNLPAAANELTHTFTSCSGWTWSLTFSTRSFATCEMCKRPSQETPMSTKAPLPVTELTTPRTCWPSFSDTGLGLSSSQASSGICSSSSRLASGAPSFLVAS
mmetsp:Transcript_14230/g.36369  ORF Transcript_14230/g.36369 Transcript_14230/m.36369 type:complete len:215 (-) Transcript_14230:468-1112(-)